MRTFECRIPATRWLTPAVATVGVLSLAAITPAQPLPWRFSNVVEVGDSAPAPEGGTFGMLFAPALNSRGDVAVDGYPLSNAFDEGVFLARAGKLQTIARIGRLAPRGGVFGAFGLFGSIGLNDAGEVAFAFGRDPDPLAAGRPYQFGAGVYRTARGNGLKAVVVPFLTPAPAGGTFQGAGFHASINGRGTVAFAGVVPTGAGSPGPMARDQHLGQGIYLAEASGRIVTVAGPGDRAPGGVFDYGEQPWVNDADDVAFGGHLAGDTCIDVGGQSSTFIFCGASVYVREHGGRIRSVAHQGQPAPGGGEYRVAFGPVINNRGDIVFVGDLTPAPAVGDRLGIFVHRDGITFPIARPGDRMPGGGRLRRASNIPRNVDMNDAGDVVFDAALDTVTDGKTDHGLYLWSRGTVRLITRTGMTLPGLGTVQALSPASYAGLDFPAGYAVINNRGDVAFQALMTSGRSIVILATRADNKD